MEAGEAGAMAAMTGGRRRHCATQAPHFVEGAVAWRRDFRLHSALTVRQVPRSHAPAATSQPKTHLQFPDKSSHLAPLQSDGSKTAAWWVGERAALDPPLSRTERRRAR